MLKQGIQQTFFLIHEVRIGGLLSKISTIVGIDSENLYTTAAAPSACASSFARGRQASKQAPALRKNNCPFLVPLPLLL
jgi:hypothetical protein